MNGSNKMSSPKEEKVDELPVKVQDMQNTMNKRNGLLMAKEEKDENSRIKEILPTFTINEQNELLMPKDEKDENSTIKVPAVRKRRICRRKCDICSKMAYSYASSLSVDHVKTLDFILGSNLFNCLVAKKRVYFCSSHVEEEFERETVKRYGQRRTVGEVCYIFTMERANKESLERLSKVYVAPPTSNPAENIVKEEEREEKTGEKDISEPFRVCNLCSAQTRSYTTIDSWKTAKAIDFILGTHLSSLINSYRISICRWHMVDFEREIVRRYGKRRTMEDIQKMLGIGFVDNIDLGYPMEATPTRVFDEKKVKEEERGEDIEEADLKTSIGASSREVFDSPILEPLRVVKEEGIEDLRMVKLEENQSVDKQLPLNWLKEEEKVDVAQLIGGGVL